MNIAHILDHQVNMAAIAAFRLGRFHDRATYPICLPILSVLVNYGKEANSQTNPHSINPNNNNNLLH
jgi:hypothetical protein